MVLNVAKNMLRLALSLAAPSVTSDFLGVPLVLVDIADFPSSTMAGESDTLYTYLSLDSFDEDVLQSDGTNTDTDSYRAVKNMFDQTSINGYKVSKVIVGVNRSSTWLTTFETIWAQTQSFIAVVFGVLDGGVEATITDLLAAYKKVVSYGRVPFGVTDDTNVKTADAASATLAAKLYDDDVAGFLVYTESTDFFDVSGVIGQWFPENAPCTNPCYKAISGATGLSVTDSEMAYIQAKNCNILLDDGEDVVLIPFNGSSDAGGHYGGICSNGQFVDREIAKAYLQIEVPKRFYQNYVKGKARIDFNTEGSQEITAQLITLLTEIGITEPPRQFIEPDFEISVPDMSSADYSSAKKSQRWLDGVTGDGEITGAVNVINVALKFQ